MTVKERPGIYAEYRVNRSPDASEKSVTVGVAALADGGEIKRIISHLDAVQSFGVCSMTRLIKTLYLNGCGNILAAPVVNYDYASAFAALTEKGADIIICDSRAPEVLSSMKTVLLGSEYCMGIGEFDGSAADCISLAESLNFERMVICGNADETEGNIAAALAGVISSEKELFLNGHYLAGCGELEKAWTEQETEALIAGGVTPVEYDGENVVTVRGITTKTHTEGVNDRSLREIAVVRTVIYVLSSVHDALKLKFSRANNNALTRGAIRSQVAVELEKILAEGRIESYGNISALPDEEDASLCRVGFEFSAVCGLSTIALTAYLDV